VKQEKSINQSQHSRMATLKSHSVLKSSQKNHKSPQFMPLSPISRPMLIPISFFRLLSQRCFHLLHLPFDPILFSKCYSSCFVLQFIQLNLDPASGNTLPANGNGTITQNLTVTNTQYGQVSLSSQVISSNLFSSNKSRNKIYTCSVS
jgi:Adaptin C-terminal domain